jgi:glycosyltransferase involved in cell wall biosynthesis
MMSKFKITLAIPTYNRDKFLKRTLENVKNEIGKIEDKSIIIEILVSDNCSEDTTKSVCKDFSNSYKYFVYHKNKKNLGYKGNILKLLELARGEYIWFMGDDDGVANDGFNTLLKAIKDYKADLYFGDSLIVELNQKAYYRNLDLDTKITFKEFSDTNLFRNSGKISNFIITKQQYLKEVKKIKTVNSIWTHIQFALYSLNDNCECYIILKPISLAYHSASDNLAYNGEALLKIFTNEYINFYYEFKNNFKETNLKYFQNVLVNNIDYKRILKKSAFTDDYFSLLKYMIYIIKRLPNSTLKIKFFLLYLLPNLTPFSIKRFIIKYIGYLLKGKQKTDGFIEKMRLKKEILDGKNKDKSARSVLTFND